MRCGAWLDLARSLYREVCVLQGMHMSAETEEKIEGAHNFRQVCGFPVFGVGQPNPEGIKVALEKIKGSCDEKNNKELFKQS